MARPKKSTMVIDPRQTQMVIKPASEVEIPYDGSPTIKRLLEALYPFMMLAEAAAGLADEQSFFQAASLKAKHFKAAREAYFSVVKTGSK